MNHSNIVNLPLDSATALIKAHLRVKIDSNGEAVLSGADEAFLGTNLQDVTGTVDGTHARNVAAVALKGYGTHYATAAGAIALGAEVDAAASGKVETTGGAPIGIALEAASADGDVIRVFYYNPVARPAQAAHIANPTGGATQDAEARTAINSILVVLENAKLTATS